MNLAQLVDAIPVVQSTADRGVKFPTPVADMRVFNKQTKNVERYDIGAASWVIDVYGNGNVGSPNLMGIGGDGTSLLDTIQIGPAVIAAGRGLQIFLTFGGAGVSQAYLVQTSFAHARVTPAYAVNIVINCALGDEFEIVPTDGVAFTINIPTFPNLNAARSQRVKIKIKNTFGVLGAVTFTGGAGGYRLGAAWVQPANGFSRSIEFHADGTNFIEAFRSAADVAN